MLKGILTIILFILVVMTIIVLMITNAIAKFFKKMRNTMEERRNEESDAYFQRYSQKTGYRQQEKIVFDKDYFDSVDNYGWQKREPEKEAPRSTTTKEGTVIIDHRTPKSSDQKKIFDDGDGEYVEFSEVKE